MLYNTKRTFRKNNALRIFSCNINGLNNVEKLGKVKHKWLLPDRRHETPDIYTFQESKSTPNVEKLWNRLLPGKVLYSHGNQYSRGIVLGIHYASPVSFRNSVSDPEGRYIIAECCANSEMFTVASVYLEPHIEVQTFSKVLADIARVIDGFGHPKVVWVGDFNIALRNDMDSTSTGRTYTARKDVLLPFMDAHELTDIWRAMHPFEKVFTTHARTRDRTVLSRLDYFLTSPAFLTSVVDCDIKSAYCSDHSPVTLDFHVDGCTQGKGYWKFPDFLLRDFNFRPLIRECINEVRRDNPDCEPGVLWDLAKCKFRGAAIQYLSLSKRERRARIEQIESEIATATAMRDRNASNSQKVTFYAAQVASLQDKLDDQFAKLNEAKTKYYRAKSYYESNRCTKYYFQLPRY